MRMSRGRWAWSLAIALLAPATLPAQQPVPAPKGKLVQDVWETAYLDGYRVGYMHLTVEELTRADGKKVLRAARDLSFSVRRGGDLARIKAVTGSDELADGTVLGVFMKQGLAENVVQEVRGQVVGNQLQVKAEGKLNNSNKIMPWNPKAVGTLGELNILKARKPKPGDAFDYVTYEPTVNVIVTIRVKAEAYEEIVLGNQRVKLLRLSAVPDRFADMQLPGQVLWVDQDFEVRRSATAMPGMGYLLVDRSTKEDATRPLNPAQLPDLMERQSIKLGQRISWPHQRSHVVYRITLPADDTPSTAFAQDARQVVGNISGKTFDLTVTAIRQPPTVTPTAAADPGKEFTESNYFITSDDPLVKRHAAAAVPAGMTDPWEKAKAIERWVHANMKAQNFSEAMAPGFEVARTLAGDCTEYSMLTAAMCRAAGVPSRTAIGLVYVEGNQPLLGFHMWTEVYVRGQWVAIDATLGQGSVGPGHLKITDASWHDTRSMTPLLPIMRVMIGRPAVTVVEAK
jgi:hypothetical protein